MVKTAKTAKEAKVNKSNGKPLHKFRLLASKHEQADPLWEPNKLEIEEARSRGTIPRAPTQKINAGETFYSDKDLVTLLGSEKVQLLSSGKRVDDDDDDESEDPVIKDKKKGFAHPGGQVSEGFQHTGAVDHKGDPVSGPISEEELKERGLLPEPPPDKSEKRQKVEEVIKPAPVHKVSHQEHTQKHSSHKDSKSK